MPMTIDRLLIDYSITCSRKTKIKTAITILPAKETMSNS